MNLNDLANTIKANGPFKWIDPKSIEEIDPVALKFNNEHNWFCKFVIVENIEGADEIITDYLYECLLERKMLIDKGKPIPKGLDIDATMLVKAGIYMICHFGSSYAGTHLSSWRELLTANNAGVCIELLISAYKKSHSFTRDILRDFILELFRYGPLWEPQIGYFSKLLSDHQNNFLNIVLENGYLTIDNQDARLFIDGSKRI